MAADGEGKEASSFRWIDAARYVVASVVTMLIVVVVVMAKMVLRPKSLYLSVPGGSLFVRRLAPPNETLSLDFTLRAQNPSRRISLYYVDVTGYLFDNTIVSAESTSNPKDDSIAYFHVADMFLAQNAEQFSSKTVNLSRGVTVEPSYFDVLYEGDRGGRNIISDVTLRLDGTLITQPTSIFNFNKTARGPGRTNNFYCRPLLIGGNRDVDAYINKQEAFCVSGAAAPITAEKPPKKEPAPSSPACFALPGLSEPLVVASFFFFYLILML